MFKKGTKLYSIFKQKCPVCHEGDYFKSKLIFSPKAFSEHPEKCEVCHHKFEIETGFFYGAMYVSYALAVAFSVATFVAIKVLFPDSPYWVYLIAILSNLFLLAPVTYRLSRMIWMNLFTKYKGKG